MKIPSRPPETFISNPNPTNLISKTYTGLAPSNDGDFRAFRNLIATTVQGSRADEVSELYGPGETDDGDVGVAFSFLGELGVDGDGSDAVGGATRVALVGASTDAEGVRALEGTGSVNGQGE